MTQIVTTKLTDPFWHPSGQRLRTPREWAAHRQHLLVPLLALQYGELPPAPACPVQSELLHRATLRDMQGAALYSLRVHAAHLGSPHFALQVWAPSGNGPWPVVLSGDACWHYATDRVKALVLERGYCLAQFNRVELASDTQMSPVSPAHAAIATWAWGYHRCLDALLQLDFVNPSQIAVVGHSRGGKAALLAGATDERIALTSANNSGAGGAGCYRWRGQGAETLADIVQTFPHWFNPRLAEYANNEHLLPFDQHFLKALIAPRALLTTEALDDLWANPEGTWQTHQAALEVYRFLGAEQRMAIHWRMGGHAHTLQDWSALLDFADSEFRNTAKQRQAQANPFLTLPRAFGWASPLAADG